MGHVFKWILIPGVVALSACTSTFVSSWKAPDAAPLEVAGSKVAAVVMVENESSRRMGEDVLAQEITERGAQGVPLYKLLPDADLSNEEQTRAALKQAGIEGVVVMQPVSIDKEVVSTPGYYGPSHAGSVGWGSPWAATNNIHTNTIVYVDTQVYSLKQDKLVWSGQSKTINPGQVDDLVRDLSAVTAQELEKQGLIQ
jgi:hypothetical protein